MIVIFQEVLTDGEGSYKYGWKFSRAYGFTSGDGTGDGLYTGETGCGYGTAKGTGSAQEFRFTGNE